MLRLYRASRHGLVEVAPSPQAEPTDTHGPAPLAGEQVALERHLGLGIQFVDAREPTLLEAMAGLASVVQVRLPDDREIGCGVGWHGPLAFVLQAEFPRFDTPLALPPSDEAAVQDALRRYRLIRHETRRDEGGLAVLARQHGGQVLFLLRSDGQRVSPKRYQPGTGPAASEEQRRWMRYAGTYEHLNVLDHYRDGSADDLIMLTADPSGHVWRHLIDPDGVEAWRRPADDAAVAVLHRERLAIAQSDAAMPDAEPPQPVPEVEPIAAPPDG